MLNPAKTAAAAALLGLFGSPLAAQVMHEGMTCTDFEQSTPEVQTEVVESFLAEEGATATEMTNEELVSMILNECNVDAAADEPVISVFREAVSG